MAKDLRLDLSKYRKVKSDEKTTTLQHPQGHQIIVAHAALPPKMRGQLAALPMSDGGVVPGVGKRSDVEAFQRGVNKEKPKTDSGSYGRMSNAEDAAEQGEAETAKEYGPARGVGYGYAGGGQVDKGPAIDPDKAKQMQAGATQSGWQPEKWGQNVKKAFGYADGGKVEEKPKTVGEIINYPGTPKPSPSPKNMADGGLMDPIDGDQNSSQMPPQSAPSQQQAPVVVNVNGGQQQQPAPESIAYHVGNSVRQGVQDALGAFKTVASPIVGAAGDAIKGVSGVPQEQPMPQPEAPAQPEQNPIAGGLAAGVAPAPAANPAMADPYGTNAAYDATTEGLQRQIQGITGQGIAEAKLGKEQSDLLDSAQAQQQKLLNTYQQHLQGLESERQNFMQDYQNQHIDPNHYLSSMGTGKRIATAIGLILGGVSSGVTGQANPAGSFLNAQIDRDIDAQKAEMGKRQNLLNLNMQQFHNLRDATDMTRVMQQDIVANQLKKAAALAMDPMARARALKEAGALEMSSANTIGQMSMRRSLLSGVAAGQVSPDKIVNFLVPENERGEANKELKEAQDTVAMRDNLMSAFDQLNQTNTVGNRAMHLGFTPAAVEAVRDPLLAAMSKGTAGRFTEADAHMLAPLFPAPGDSPSAVETKRRQLNTLVSEKMHFPKLSAWGINANSFGRYGTGGQQQIQEKAPKTK